MDTKLLNDFVVLCEVKNFTIAAKRRFITQSAFSRRIKGLEQWAETKLVIRHKNTISLTPAGKQMLFYAKEIITNVDNAYDSMKSYSNKNDNKVIVAAQNTIMRNFLPKWIDLIEEKTGNLYWSLRSEKMQLSIESFLDNKIDFLLCYKNNDVIKQMDKSKHDYIKLGNEVLVPVVKFKGKFHDTNLSKSNQTIPLLAYSNDSFFGIKLNEIIKLHQLFGKFNIIFDHHYSNILHTMVLQDRGVAWLPMSSIKHELENNILKIIGNKKFNLNLDIIMCSYKEYSNPLHKNILNIANLLKIHAKNTCVLIFSQTILPYIRIVITTKNKRLARLI